MIDLIDLIKFWLKVALLKLSDFLTSLYQAEILFVMFERDFMSVSIVFF